MIPAVSPSLQPWSPRKGEDRKVGGGCRHASRQIPPSLTGLTGNLQTRREAEKVKAQGNFSGRARVSSASPWRSFPLAEPGRAARPRRPAARTPCSGNLTPADGGVEGPSSRIGERGPHPLRLAGPSACSPVTATSAAAPQQRGSRTLGGVRDSVPHPRVPWLLGGPRVTAPHLAGPRPHLPRISWS